MKKKFWGDKHAPGPAGVSTAVRIGDLMADRVVAVSRHQTVGHARQLMRKLGIHSLPVLDGEGAPVGIVTSSDLLDGVRDETLVGRRMSRDVRTVARYAPPHTAARLMRKHRIHHLVVTHEQKVIGVVSSFDLLALVEERRFVGKNLSTPRKKKEPRRDQAAGA